MTERPITCEESDVLRDSKRVLSSLTNWVGDSVVDHRLPPETRTLWGTEDGTPVLREVLNADGCRHWALDGEGDSDA